MNIYEVMESVCTDGDNGEYVSYGVAAHEGAAKIVIENISTNRAEVEKLVADLNTYGLAICHLEEYIHEWFCRV